MHGFTVIGLQGFVIIRVIRVSTRVHLLACCGANDRLEGGLGLIVAVEQQRATLRAPRDPVIHTPERDQFHRFVMLNERPEQTRIRVGQLPVGVVHQAALGGRSVVGVRAVVWRRVGRGARGEQHSPKRRAARRGV